MRKPDADLDARLEEYVREQQGRALGQVRRTSNTTNQSFSTGLRRGAQNLLEKALIRLERGDRDAAQPFVVRALALPYDDHEETQPAVWEAHMLLYTDLSDDMEASDPDDSSWIDRAETLMAASPPIVQLEIRQCLAALLTETESPRERRRLTALTQGVGMNDEPLADVVDADARVGAVLDLLEAVIRLRRMLADLE